jgi:hypothetical protein
MLPHMQPRRELDGAVVVQWAEVTDDVLPTGRTRHVVDDEQSGQFAALAIARYPDAEGVYLFYLDAGGGVGTDTHHESIQAAVAQADYEYIGLRWRPATEE